MPAFKFFLFPFSLFIILPLSGLIAQKAQLEKQVDQLMADFDRSDAPGVAIGVVQDGEAVFAKGYGIANLDYDIPITPSTVFDIASVSKQFGAMAIAMLVDQGKLSLDDDVRKYIPEVPDFGKTITIRHLVHHTSGVRDWPGALAMGGWRMDDVISFSQILKMVENQKELNFEPGAEYLYSNTGYNLLAETVARVTGQTFRQWTDKHIFQPLGMTNTHFQDDHTRVVKNRAFAYAWDLSGYKVQPNGLTALGSSSLFTSIEDLIKWVNNYEEQKVGGKAVMDLIQEQGVLNNGEKIAYAFGNSIGEYKGLKRVAHSGSWAGFRTYLARFPEQGLAVIVLSNNANFNPGGKAMEIADVYLAKQLKDPEKKEDPAPKKEKEVVKIDPAIFDDYAGEYELAPGFVLSFTREGDQFFTQATGQNRFEIFPSSDSTFFLRVVEAAVTFHRDADGRVSSATLHQGGDRKAKRIDPYTPSEEDLKELTGRYFSPELETVYTLALENDQLVAKHIRNENFTLTAVQKDQFQGGAWFFRQVAFERDSNGKIAGLRVSNGRVRNVWFERE